MKEILNKVAEINAANKAEKRRLVLKYMDDPDFNKFMKFCLDESLTFNVSRVAMTEPIEGDLYELLDELNLKGSASKEQKQQLAALGSQSENHLTVLNMILRKNPGCGFSAKSLHAVLPGLIPYYPYQRCSGQDALDRIFAKGHAYSDLKCDGLFMRIKISTSEGVRFESRNGKEFLFGDHFRFLTDGVDPGILDADEVDYEMFSSGMVLEGEALVRNETGTGFLPRTIGNAIINKFQGGYGSSEELSRICFSIWTCLPYVDYTNGYSPMTVHQRRQCVAQLVEYVGSGRITQTETKTVFTKEEAWEHYFEIRNRPAPVGSDKLEGTIVKCPDEVWSDGTSLLMAKIKSVKACEVEIYGWERGKPGGKNEHRLGSFLIRSSCGRLVGKCSGMTDAIRDDDPEKYVGKIAEVHFNSVSKSKDVSKPRSFDHCRYVELRSDKNQADSLEYILKVKELKCQAA